MSTFKNLIKNESGATAIEYGLIAALVSVAIIAVLGTMGNSLQEIFQTVADELSNASDTAGGTGS